MINLDGSLSVLRTSDLALCRPSKFSFGHRGSLPGTYTAQCVSLSHPDLLIVPCPLTSMNSFNHYAQPDHERHTIVIRVPKSSGLVNNDPFPTLSQGFYDYSNNFRQLPAPEVRCNIFCRPMIYRCILSGFIRQSCHIRSFVGVVYPDISRGAC